MSILDVFFTGNVFRDIFANVSKEFLQQNSLKNDQTKIEPNLEIFSELCQKAIGSEGIYKERSGGSGARIMAVSAHLNRTSSLTHLQGSTTLIGRVGNDTFGQEYQKYLKDIGVESLLVVSDLPSGTALCLQTDGERTMVVNLGATSGFNAADFDLKKIRKFNHLHLEGYAFFFGIVATCLEIAKNFDARVSMNLPTVDIVKLMKKQFQETLPHLQYLFGNKEEIMELKDKSTIEEALASFDPSQLVCATAGELGCWIKAPGETSVQHFQALKVHCITNKTGAGDLWTGIFLALFLRGAPIPKCVEKANLGASKWIQLELGAELPLDVWEIISKDAIQF